MTLTTPIIPQPTRRRAVTGRGLPRHETAQIAFQGEQCWRIIGPFWEETGLCEDFPLPRLSCPVVDVRAADPDATGEVIRKALSPAGCGNVPALVEALKRIGAKA